MLNPLERKVIADEQVIGSTENVNYALWALKGYNAGSFPKTTDTLNKANLALIEAVASLEKAIRHHE